MVNRWTVFGDNHKGVRTGTAKGEYEVKVAALKAIDELKKEDAKTSQSAGRRGCCAERNGSN
jgi:hypothetical protein